METKRLLKVRATIKKKKPKFGRKDWNKKPRIEKDVWRKARGADNKQRLHRKGHKKSPKQGYRSPAEVRGMTPGGLVPVLVSNPKALSTLSKATHGVIVASGLGDKKRKIILQEAQKLGFAVLNLDASKTVEQIDARLKHRQAERQKQLDEHKKAEAATKKEHKKEHAPKEKELTPEEKQAEEKKEKDEVLTSKQ